MARIDHDEVEDSSLATVTTGHSKLPEQARALAGLGAGSVWLDGEMVVANQQGVPDFQALQNAFEAGRSGNILYYLFDMPYLNGVDLREVPVEERRAALATVLNASKDPRLRFSDAFGEDPRRCSTAPAEMHMEGLIGKRLG